VLPLSMRAEHVPRPYVAVIDSSQVEAILRAAPVTALQGLT